MDKKELTYKEVWDTLSKIDCSKYVEKKMNLSYVSWANAYTILMDHYPQAEVSFYMNPNTHVPYAELPDGSAEVRCGVKIDNLYKEMFLPVMDNRNNAIIKPNARQVSDAKQRCLVKCLASFGLAMYLYAGEDLPREEEKPKKKQPKKEEGFDANGSPTAEEPKKQDDLSMNEAWAKTFVEGFEKMVVAFDKAEQVKDFYMSNEQDILAIKDIDKKYKKQIDEIVKKQIRLKENNNG
jgi:hypothetical protein|tara:strand:- start:2175 stop:2885 length:711 start_codon:yes stop_codon:yes gene_type:complete